MSTNEHLDAIHDVIDRAALYGDEYDHVRQHAEALVAELEAERAAESEDFSGKLDALRDANTRWQIQCAELKNALSTERARNNALREAFRALAISTMPSAEDEEDGWLFAVADDHGAIEEYFERIDDEEATR